MEMRECQLMVLSLSGNQLPSEGWYWTMTLFLETVPSVTSGSACAERI